MKFKKTDVAGTKEILANDHYVGIPYDCTVLTALAVNGIIPAGTVIPANDGTAQGILLSDVDLGENPNGTIVIHGFIKASALPAAPSADAKAALVGVQFLGSAS